MKRKERLYYLSGERQFPECDVLSQVVPHSED